MDAAAELTSRLAGRRLTDITRREYDWGFGFDENVGLSVSCPWRILLNGRIAFAGSDDGQQFGLPTPIDGVEETRRLIGQSVILRVAIRMDAGDLALVFSNGAMLEVINMSAGYESWHMSATDMFVIGTGGGELAIFASDPNA
jgi:Family of unknown function (DUF6188)